MTNSEKYIILEEDYPYFKRVDLEIDSIDSQIRVSNIEKINLTEKVNNQNFSADKVILALNSRRATTVENYFSIKRDNPKDPINGSELDNLVFKGLWNFLDSYRGWSSDKMKISDMDMTLANIEILNIFIDSHNIVNPLNVKGSTFSIKIRGTFIPRDTLSFFSNLSFFNKKLSIVERASAISSFLGDKKGTVVSCDGLETNIFKNSKDEVKFIKRRKWGLNDLVDITSESLSINDNQASLILDRYLQDEVSKDFKKYLDGKLSESFKKLAKIIESIPRKRDKVFVNLPGELFDKISIKKTSINHIDFQDILKSKGFSVTIDKREEIIDSMNKDYLALLGFYLFSSPHNEDLNDILQRRSKWLVPNNK